MQPELRNQIKVYLLKNSSGTSCEITNYGARILKLFTQDRQGRFDDIVLGFETLDEYLHTRQPYFGATIGRCANRIYQGKFSLSGQTYSLPINNPPNHIHGGEQGFHAKTWSVIDVAEEHVKMQLTSPDGEMGYPGNLQVRLSYHLNDNNQLTIDYAAECDQPCPVNLTHHSFFNLSGTSDSIDHHLLQINASHFAELNQDMIPTGKLLACKGSPFDFTGPKAIGRSINDSHGQLQIARGYDHHFVFDKSYGKLELAANVYDPGSGRTLSLHTDEPGLQFYSGNFLDGTELGKGGRPLTKRTGFCLEPQHLPDSANQPEFPSVILKPDEIYRSKTVFKFGTEIPA